MITSLPRSDTSDRDLAYDHRMSGAVRILLVEDDLDIANALIPALRRYGLMVTHVRTAADALAADPGDLVLLDLGLPDGDGINVCRQIRTVSDVPVIAVTARGEAADRVRGLRSGADDYVVKPFAISELLARIDAVLRRTGLLQPRPRVTVGDLTVDIEARTVQVADKPISLTRKEFDVLAVLAAHHGRVVPREQVALYAWQSVFEASSRTMDVHVASLRAKLGRPELVQTIRGVGYRLGSD
ncbi:MAG TPA: response regulator transcription factor [Kribbella sp.]